MTDPANIIWGIALVLGAEYLWTKHFRASETARRWFFAACLTAVCVLLAASVEGCW